MALLALLASGGCTSATHEAPHEAPHDASQETPRAPSQGDPPPRPTGSPAAPGTRLTSDELALATATAADVAHDQGATVTSASAVVRPGGPGASNTGHPCTSGHVLRIKLIGDFPHTVTTGHPVAPGGPSPDFTVRAMIVSADASTGVPCLIGVQTAENGEPQPLPGGTDLQLR